MYCNRTNKNYTRGHDYPPSENAFWLNRLDWYHWVSQYRIWDY